jgi:hypothetical protein
MQLLLRRFLCRMSKNMMVVQNLHLSRGLILYSDKDEAGGSKVLRNIGILPQHYTASQPRRPRLEISPS